MSIKKSFGIGCYHFGIKKDVPFKFQGIHYINELKIVLSKISSLTNLKIETDDEFEYSEILFTEDTVNIEEGEGFFPSALYLNIEFDLYIPFRIQSEITDVDEKFLNTYTENFKIKIFQSYYSPVTIIESLNPTRKNEPSTGVQIVREFIIRELTNNKSDYIRFECLGPSPFHCNFFIEPKLPEEEYNWLFTIDEQIKRGYNTLTFFYNSVEIEDAEEALDYLNNSIEDEFGFFYKTIQTRNAKMHAWQEINSSLDSLIEIQNTNGIVGIIKRYFKRQKLISKLYTDIVTFEGKSIYINSLQQNEYNDTFSIKDEIFFKSLIDKELEEKLDYPIKQTTDLIQFFESRRVKSLELTTSLIAAILGGLIGALITISIDKNQSKHEIHKPLVDNIEKKSNNNTTTK